jgi:hypothetical protein
MWLSRIIKKSPAAKTEGSPPGFQPLETGSADNPFIRELKQAGTQFTYRGKKDNFGKFYV